MTAQPNWNNEFMHHANNYGDHARCASTPRANCSSMVRAAAASLMTVGGYCNWNASMDGDPSRLGRRQYALPMGALDDDFPFACAAGLLGTADPGEQGGSGTCAGPCPPVGCVQRPSHSSPSSGSARPTSCLQKPARRLPAPPPEVMCVWTGLLLPIRGDRRTGPL